jgi:hypothetical protein
MMPEVSRLDWAKDDFNDFSTHHHSRRKEDSCVRNWPKFRPHPSVTAFLLMPKKSLELLRRESGSLGCPCVHFAYLVELASMIDCVATAYSFVVSRDEAERID